MLSKLRKKADMLNWRIYDDRTIILSQVLADLRCLNSKYDRYVLPNNRVYMGLSRCILSLYIERNR